MLGANEKYRAKFKSVAFPNLPMDRFAELVLRLGEKDEGSLMREFIAWLRTDVVAKPRAKNGKK